MLHRLSGVFFVAALVLMLPLVFSRASFSDDAPVAERPLHPGPAPVDRTRFRKTVRSLDMADAVDLRNVRSSLLDRWASQYGSLRAQLEGIQRLPEGAAEQVYDRHTLCLPDDVDPLSIVLSSIASKFS